MGSSKFLYCVLQKVYNYFNFYGAINDNHPCIGVGLFKLYYIFDIVVIGF